nr:DUF3025 domain-containing protein [Ramlibacter aurantiacus]
MIDWSAPWFDPWREAGEPVEARIQAGTSTWHALNIQAGDRPPVRFVPQEEMQGAPYERFIFESGCCPTREGLHDFFNGLVWLRLPRAKARLNALQAEQIAARGIGPARGPVRDAITLFDENGALLQAPQPLWDALRQRQWHRLFIELRPLWEQARLQVFGHALLEKLVLPRKDLTAHVWCSDAPLRDPADTDDWLQQQFTQASLARKPFTPLPVLGIPGWWPANRHFSFYDDSDVFRPARKPA